MSTIEVRQQTDKCTFRAVCSDSGDCLSIIQEHGEESLDSRSIDIECVEAGAVFLRDVASLFLRMADEVEASYFELEEYADLDIDDEDGYDYF